jgi:hypothetical protein
VGAEIGPKPWRSWASSSHQPISVQAAAVDHHACPIGQAGEVVRGVATTVARRSSCTATCGTGTPGGPATAAQALSMGTAPDLCQAPGLSRSTWFEIDLRFAHEATATTSGRLLARAPVGERVWWRRVVRSGLTEDFPEQGDILGQDGEFQATAAGVEHGDRHRH